MKLGKETMSLIEKLWQADVTDELRGLITDEIEAVDKLSEEFYETLLKSADSETADKFQKIYTQAVAAYQKQGYAIGINFGLTISGKTERNDLS